MFAGSGHRECCGWVVCCVLGVWTLAVDRTIAGGCSVKGQIIAVIEYAWVCIYLAWVCSRGLTEGDGRTMNSMCRQSSGCHG